MTYPFGNNIKLYIEGASHDEKIEMLLFGFPKGMKVDFELMRSVLARRAPGQSDFTTSRREADEPVFLSGITDGVTDGSVIHAVIYNKDADSSAYKSVNDIPRPSHADYAAVMKYGKEVDLRGGGHFSGRLTAAYCVAGALCIQYLKEQGIEIFAHIKSIGNISDTDFDKVNVGEAQQKLLKESSFPVLNSACGEKMKSAILQAKSEGDSLGGVIECAVTGLPAGLGEHLFAGCENRISQAVFGVPAVKGVEFGLGFGSAKLKGSENNDGFIIKNGEIALASNNSGGILGGMTTGFPLVFSAAVKPTPSIAAEQQSVSLSEKKQKTVTFGGRHDPCIVPRAVPVIECAAAVALCDMLLDKKENCSQLDGLRSEIDACDRNIVESFCRRNEISRRIGDYKKQNSLPVFDPVREQKLLEKISALAGENSVQAQRLYKLILEISKEIQQ